MNITDIGWFRLAKSAAECSDHPTYQMGAVIADKRPVSVGCNLMKTHPSYAAGEKWYTIHAEMKALISADFDVKGCDIFIYREDAEGNPAMAKPCNECLKVLIEAGIKRVYYTNIDRWYSLERIG